MRNSNALTTAEHLDFLMIIIGRFARLYCWLLIWVAHLTAVTAGLFLLWAAGISPENVAAAFRHIAHGNILVIIPASGVSVLTLLAAYSKLAQWVHRTAGSGWLSRYLTKNV